MPDALQQALRRAHARKAQIVGLCAGVFVLAEAGLLDGRHASVHWLGSAAFAKRYPSVRLLKDSSHSRDDNIWTSAGGAAAIDTCLQLLHELQGGTVADLAARKLVSSTLNQKNQLSCVENADAYRDGNRRLRELLDWMRAHPHEAQHLDALAKRVSMTTRTFTRKFRQLTGMTVVQWRLRQRLKRTQLLLWTSEASIETIAQQTGFSSSLSLRKHFKKAFDMTPTAYRKKRRLDESGGCIIRPSSVSSSSQMG
ncbi:helix-turn-helix domain-containing protein [Alcaligenaceae bacterium CGII-47]|nr:helix-turn-helix domain-containing protein [Alcaligenaceae bacterium CGII-47]